MIGEGRVCLSCGIRVSWISLFVNLALAALKCGIGILADSQALVACALYSLNDALSSAVALISLRLARRPADLDHTYGHGKAEFVAVGSMAFILAAAVIYFLCYALPGIISGKSIPPHMVALLVAMVTASISYFLCRWEACAAHHLGSPVMHTSAEHNHADALSSALTVVGIGGAMIGLRFLDPLVAILETLDIMRLSGTLLGSTLKGLMDTSLPPDEVRAIEQAARVVPEVKRLVRVRSRQAGPQTWLDIEIQLAASLSVEKAQQVSAAVRQAVQSQLGRSAEIQVRFSSSPYAGADAAIQESHA